MPPLNVGIPITVTNGLTYAFAILSSISSFGAICLFALLYKTNGHFIAREKLVLTLIIAGFINAVNTSLSTLAVVLQMPISDELCAANGWIAQFSVQINDFTHFAMAIVTFYILTHCKSSYAMEVVESYIHYILAVIWFVPIITASVGGAVNGFGWSGTWCWFKGTPVEVANIVRYTLTHGPRIFIFITLICVYCGLWFILRKKHCANLKELKELKKINGNCTSESHFKYSNHNSPNIDNTKLDEEVTHAINKMLLYPVFYIILWSGGMANRVVEATGNTSDLTTFLQAFTRLVTFADSALFAYNYAWKRVIKANSKSTLYFSSRKALNI